ncbi:MAG: MATE family efflux transporter [Firmicutes bacterium]|nr:MATE family efflux transporter [Bacillota bacterium]
MEKTHNGIAQEFNLISLLRFVAPTVVMLVFMSLYQMVDAVFVSKFVGENALSALNIVYPFPSIVIAVSIMLATGGSAIIARNMGEGKEKEAKENFSFIVLVGAVIGVAIATAGILFIEPLIYMLGATPSLYDYCYEYLFILVLSVPLSVFQMLFQSFFVTAGKPHLGLTLTVLGGVSNIVLDYVFIVLCGFGVSGAALATSIGYSIPGLFGLIYFAVSRKGTLYFVKPVFRWGVLFKCCINGSSEMVNNLAVAVTTFLFNVLMLKYAGEAGVAAITIVLYAQFLMTSAFMGFSSGIAPVVSFNYGSGNVRQLKKIFKISVWVIAVVSAAVFVIAETCSDVVIMVFTPAGSEVFGLTKYGFAIFSFSFLCTGMNIFASALFTAFSNGKISAILSFLRTFVFLTACLLFLPLFWGVDGIWLAVPVAEVMALFVSVYYLVRFKKVYQY